MDLLRQYPVVFFFLLAYFFVWLQALFPNPIFSILGVASPTLATVLMLALLRERENPLAALFQWRAATFWYLVAILGQPLIALVVVGILALLGQTPDNFTAALPLAALPAIFIGRLLTNVWEEVGWRGFALPRLQSRTNALAASLIIGLFWGFWHLPLYFGDAGPQAELPFLLLLVDTVLISVVYTWIYNNTGGSLLFVTLFHVTGNTVDLLAISAGAPLIPYFILRLIIILVVDIVLVVLTGATRLSKQMPQHGPADNVGIML